MLFPATLRGAHGGDNRSPTERPASHYYTSSVPPPDSAHGNAPTTGWPTPPTLHSPPEPTATCSTAPRHRPRPQLRCRATPGTYQDALERLDKVITADARARVDAAHARIDAGRLPTLAEFDVIRGLTGIGSYLLRRDPGESNCGRSSNAWCALPSRSPSTTRRCRAGGSTPHPTGTTTSDSGTATPTPDSPTESAAPSPCSHWPLNAASASTASRTRSPESTPGSTAGASLPQPVRPGPTGSTVPSYARGTGPSPAHNAPAGATAPRAWPASSSSQPWRPATTTAARWPSKPCCMP